MSWWVWVAVAAAVAAVVIASVVVAAQRSRRRRTAHLRDRFGSEYERALGAAGGRRKAETELEDRLRRHDRLQIAPVPSSQRVPYEREWGQITTKFERTPVPALAHAEALASTVLAEMGYPMDSFAQRVADLSVDYPNAVEHYRRAHTAYRRTDEGTTTSEDLYEALQHYKALLDEILGDSATTQPEAVPLDAAAPRSTDNPDGSPPLASTTQPRPQ
jgi:hypothetical protein